MKGSSRDNRLILIAFALPFVLLALLAGLFVAGESRKARILFEYEADRIAAGLLDDFRSSGATDASGLDARIKAFGIYRATGEAMTGFGSIPAKVTDEEAAQAFRYDPSTTTLTLVRSIGTGPGRPDGMRGGPGERGPAMMGQGRGGILFLRLDARSYFRTRRLYSAGTVIVPLVVAGIAAGFLLLVASNMRFRRRDEERETLARLGESARTLAHEIRNPLSAIRMQTGLLRRGSAGGTRELDIIDEEIERLNTLSRRVGDFLRSPAGTPEKIPLGDHLRELARRSPYPFHLAENLPAAAVWFDKALLRSVVENLTRNAWESYDAAPGDRPVEVGLAREGSTVVLTVRDRGKGIPRDRPERVFDPFFTDKIHGSGIGLPLSRRFVEAAGGTLTIAARDGGGAEARVTLPVMGET